MDNKKEILEHLRNICQESMRQMIVSEHFNILTDNLGEYQYDYYFDNFISFDETVKTFEENRAKLKELGVTNVKIISGDDEDYDTRPNTKILVLEGVNLTFGFEYVYYSYGESEAANEIEYMEPYEEVVVKYKKVKLN